MQSNFFEAIIENTLKDIEKNHSTAKLGLLFQSLISDALDKNHYALMASLDVSAAFDVEKMDIIGIPAHLVSLIDAWLAKRIF